jgi:hypothetical protein
MVLVFYCCLFFLITSVSYLFYFHFFKRLVPVKANNPEILQFLESLRRDSSKIFIDTRFHFSFRISYQFSHILFSTVSLEIKNPNFSSKNTLNGYHSYSTPFSCWAKKFSLMKTNPMVPVIIRTLVTDLELLASCHPLVPPVR